MRNAIQAFEVRHSTIYLLKPVVPDRLAVAIAKLQSRSVLPRLEQVFVKEGDRCWFVRLSDIFLLESEGNYTRLYFGKQRPLVPRSLAALQERLDAAIFFRVGRRHIINLRCVEGVEPSVAAGNLLVALRDGVKVEMSRRQSVRFREALSI